MFSKSKYILLYNSNKRDYNYYINKKRKKYKNNPSQIFINKKTTLLKNIKKMKNNRKMIQKIYPI